MECKCILCNGQHIQCNICFLCQNDGECNLIEDDEDENRIFFNNQYYTPFEFKNMIANYDNSSTVSMANFNCRSLKHNFDTFNDCLDTFSYSLSFIGICETWFKQGDEKILTLHIIT